MDIKVELLKLGAVLLPILSMLIPKLITDGRTRNLLSSIELGADLKSNAYDKILKEVAEFKELAKQIIEGRDVLEEIRVAFVKTLTELNVIDSITTDITALKNDLVTTMELIQDLMITAHDTINVKVVIEEQNKEIRELKDLVLKLNTRLGGK